ncbi:MAG: aromatic amino acid lyase [Bacteroidetes bacterium]|nr:aromatic amino acid lyase [Bacteroidota bacterium]
MAILKEHYNLAEFASLFHSGEALEIDQAMRAKVQANAEFLTHYLEQSSSPVYGVNTGFGSLQNVGIPEHELHELQRNLLITHAAGVGQLLPRHLVRCMWLLKILNISKAHSAVRTEVLDRMLLLYNLGYAPQVHEQGSLGASGDLAPLAEMVLPLIGMGNLEHPEHGTESSESVLSGLGLQPLVLFPKEALALINGTQFMLAHALLLADSIVTLRNALPEVAALSAEVYLCRQDPFLPPLHHVRPHAGQIQAAAEMLDRLGRGSLQVHPRAAVQDPYSFRCIPQVHGASYTALEHCLNVWETELNSVTDNPTVFPEENAVLSGGNFHGQPLALTLDYAAMALAELGSISERRTYLLVSGQRDLPAFLAPNPGTDSGYMIAQYTAASLASQNKQLCTPASVDSIMSSNGQEDHVSMGANAAIKALKVMENVQQIQAIEFLCAAQAWNFRKAAYRVSGEQGGIADKYLQKLNLSIDEHTHTPMHALIARAAAALG